MVIILKRESVWIKDIKIDNVNSLNKNIDVDVLIIGGGITGISSAYYLKDSKLNVCVVEQGYIGMGVTSKTTGKINYLQETIYSDLEEKYSYDVARKYYDSQKFAIYELIKIIENETIDCNLEKVESYVFTSKKSEIENIKFEKDILERFGVSVKEHFKLGNKLDCKYAISVGDTYVFHPLKYLYKLKKIVLDSGIKIYEQTRIKEIKKNEESYVCFFENGRINAKKIILACHYPFFLKPYMMPLKVYTEKSYVTASKVKDYKNETFITSSIPVKSVRYHKGKNNYMIYLSSSHNICNQLNEENNFKKVVEETKRMGLKPDYIWANDDVMSVDGMPYIGRIERNNDSLLLGSGFSTWGMTNGTLAGYCLSRMILGKNTDYDEIFDPMRACSLNNIGSCLVNAGSSLKSIVENKLVKNKKWYSDNVKFEVRNGKNVAIYNDGKREHIVLSNCPHMGCTLLFNEFEKTWDCPCHASRFDLDGKVIKGPSSYDISYNEKD